MTAKQVDTKSLMGKRNTSYPAAGTPPSAQPLENGQRRPREKFSDVGEIERALQLAAVTLKPDELSGRQLISRLMPHLYILRQKGFSFTQITRVFNDASGNSSARLQVASIKAYYNEFIAAQIDNCETTLKKAMEVADQVETLTRRNPQELVAEAVAMQKMIAASKGTSAANRLVDAQTQRAALTGGDLKNEKLAPASRPVEKKAPPPAALESPPATGSTSWVGKEGKGSAVDEIPIPSRPPVTNPVPVPEKPAITAPTTPVASKKGGQAAETRALVCTTVPTPETMLAPNDESLDGVAREFFSDSILEHPSIDALMLSRSQRLYKTRLQYTIDGAAALETVQQMHNRIKWRKVPKATPSRTEGDFVKMDSSLFGKS